MPRNLTPAELAGVTGGAGMWRRAVAAASRFTEAMYFAETMPKPSKPRPRPEPEPEHPLIKMFGHRD